MPTVERHAGAFIIRGRNYRTIDEHGIDHGFLVQSDWDFPAVATELGWSLARVQGNAFTARHLSRRSTKGCQHSSTDGTVTCSECGVTASAFITAAAEFLRNY